MKRAALIGFLAATVTLGGQSTAGQQEQNREQLFQKAVAQYEAGRYREAVQPLERLVKEAPNSFEVHELLGLVYAAQSEDANANEHLAKAVLLKPNDVAARSNLAASFARLGKLDQAEEQFAKAAELAPNNFDTNHNLGEIYVHRGDLAKAIPYLKKAQEIEPNSYNNGYDLSLAYFMNGRLEEARFSVKTLLKVKDTGELHNLLAQFEAAAHLEPSESNLFDWGGELLLHRTLDPAVQVFEEGTKRYPSSARMMVGLGMAYYARGNYDDAVRTFLRAADL